MHIKFSKKRIFNFWIWW